MGRQETQVLNYLRSHPFITGDDAHFKLRIYRLSEIIRRLRARGFRIVMVHNDEPDKDGNIIRYGKYFLVEEPK